ncbi:MAG: PQQ-binding-like beta-propeller repeat protein [Ardenticatenaceae bacterium]|nr:PQQ-binding-like beta-propeller repeat protein [Ardenticatenaceae bacterium]
MYAAKRPSKWPVVVILVLASWLVVACGSRISNANWPGLTADGENVYVAYGGGVLAYNVVERTQEWLFAPQPGRLAFYAAPSVQDGRVVVGDFGASGGFFSPGVVTTIYGLEGNGGSTPDELWANSELTTDRIVASALQVGDTAFIGTSDNQLLAIDTISGDLIWKFETEHSIWAQPSYKDGIIFVTCLDKNVYALDAETGAEKWRLTLEGATAAHPLVDTDYLYVTSFDRKLHAISLSTGEAQWVVDAQDWIWGAAALSDGAVYFADAKGNVYAVDAETGDALWTQQVDGVVQASTVVANGIVYVASVTTLEDGQPAGLLTALSTDGGAQLWQQETIVPLYTTPVLVDGTLVVAVQTADTLLIAFDAATGVKQWDLPIPGQS